MSVSVQRLKPGQTLPLPRENHQHALQRIARVFGRRLTLLIMAVVSNLRFRSGLEKVWERRYAELRRDFTAQRTHGAPSRMWSFISLVYRLLLRGQGFHRFKSTMGRFLAAWEPVHTRMTEALYHLYWSSLEKRDVWGVLGTLEEPELGEGDGLLYRGRRVSIDLLQSIDEFYSLREAFGFDRDDSVVFCELGAGYGRLAHVVLTVMPQARYVIFDLPESLLLAEYYLTTLHPAMTTALCPESARVVRDPDAFFRHRLVFGLPGLLREVPRGAIDIFVNIYSFMEMRAAQVEEYFRIIEDRRVAAVYLKQNKQAANPFDRSVTTEDTYPIRAAWSKCYHRTAMLYDHVFEAAYWLRSPSETTVASALVEGLRKPVGGAMS